jgi:hypothetical protein
MALTRVTMLGASGVQHIGLGFKPFTTAGQTLDRFHWVASDMGGWALGRRLPGLRLGLNSALSALEHVSAKAVDLRVTEPVGYSVDAELYAGQSQFRIEAGPAIRFLST